MINRVGYCSISESLIIYQEELDIVSSHFQLILPECIKDLFTNLLTLLVAFCFLYPIYSETKMDISLALNEVSTSRPSFWYHVANNDLPEGT
jgi:hypothetical protein